MKVEAHTPEIWIEQISHLTTYALRHAVLWPNQPINFVKVPNDEDGLHYGAFQDGKLVSVISLFMDGQTARFRKFASAQTYQNQGIGTKLLRHTITEAKRLKATSIWCDARTNALELYQRLGMIPQGETFQKEGISYRKMQLFF